MFDIFKDRVEDKLALAQKPFSGNKVLPLREAVRKFIRPGMHLHVSHTYMRSTALIYELCRQYWGKKPDFTVSSLGLTGPLVMLVFGELVKHIITTFCGDTYPFPGPNRVYQEAHAGGRVKIENWTVLTLPQRLLAGAQGLEWMPTHSLVGSSMEKENAADLWLVRDPDGKANTFVRSLRPDLTLAHAWAADPAGNLLITPPYAENVPAFYAAKEGVVATVERMVETDFIRSYSHYAKVPSHLVKAVCPVPYGAHPAGASSYGIKEFDGYAEDEEFLLTLREACKKNDTLEAWVKKWVLDCPDQETYLTKLGYERIWYLKGKSAGDSWRAELNDQVPRMKKTEESNPVETMIIAAARLIKKKVQEGHYQTILAGIGASNLAAWKAWYDLRRENVPVDLMAEVGFFGYAPRPGEPFVFNFRNLPTSTLLTDVFTVLGALVGGAASCCLGVLGAGQVDQYGNINSTKIPEMNLFLVGSGGACDVALGAKEVVVVTPINPFRCVNKVSYITAPGERVKTLVTDLGILEKVGAGKTFVLTAYFEGNGSASQAIEKIKARCGWELEISDQLEAVKPPHDEEIKDIRIFDPKRYFLEG
jgi:acyl CoA:acetate/3-ketoacid CoA transferase alpha subunit/acyl CoA:acetate/3-ketoacid CoA transferase beta subunit